MDAFLMLLRWLHFLFGLTWIGLLYYLNFRADAVLCRNRSRRP